VARFSFRKPHVPALDPRAFCDRGEVALELLQYTIALKIELEFGEDEVAGVRQALKERSVYGKDDALPLACDVAAC
jgi:hypothetical protein